MLTFLGGYTLEYRGLVEVKVCFTSMALISHSSENSWNPCYKNPLIPVPDWRKFCTHKRTCCRGIEREHVAANVFLKWHIRFCLKVLLQAIQLVSFNLSVCHAEHGYIDLCHCRVVCTARPHYILYAISFPLCVSLYSFYCRCFLSRFQTTIFTYK